MINIFSLSSYIKTKQKNSDEDVPKDSQEDDKSDESDKSELMDEFDIEKQSQASPMNKKGFLKNQISMNSSKFNT